MIHYTYNKVEYVVTQSEGATSESGFVEMRYDPNDHPWTTYKVFEVEATEQPYVEILYTVTLRNTVDDNIPHSYVKQMTNVNFYVPKQPFK